MRVIAGRIGGRSFNSPPGHRTHPMSDKIRGALFNILGDIQGLTVLDAFAGTGALAIESISRGAASAVVLDIDEPAIRTIRQNCLDLDIQKSISCFRQNAYSWSLQNIDRKFDIVFADPPYDDLQPKAVYQLLANVKPDGLLVLSWPGREFEPEPKKARLILHKSYGDAALYVYQPLP